MDTTIRNHFAKNDPIIFQLLTQLEEKGTNFTLSQSSDYSADLCEAIVNQQLSEKAGRTIYNRFLDLLPNRVVTPTGVLALTEESIRTAGMSWSKVRFIKSLATSFIEKHIDFDTIHTRTDEEVLAQLITLHGIGKWSAEMFLMFSLGRENIFSFGDVALRRAIEKIYGFKKEPTGKQIEKIVQKWSPYKTYACRILWRSLDSNNTKSK